MDLFHYYDKDIGPFRNISALSDEQAQQVIERIRMSKPYAYCNERSAEYLELRHYYENILYNEFQKKGGICKRKVPYYMETLIQRLVIE